jgi:RNA polymerase sigma-70 factor (ECF subfamily)
MVTREQNNELYIQHARAAFRRARRMLGNVADADDLVHDVFVTLFERCHQFRGASALSTYLYSAVTYACLNRIRDNRRHAELLAAEWLDGAHEATAESLVILRDLLERLPQPLGELAVYHHLEELTQREIAQLFGCSHTHVAQLLARLAGWVAAQELTSCSG